MKTTTFLSALLITFLFTSCIAPKTPEEITTSFTNAFESKDWEGAKALATVKGVDQLESAEKSLLGFFDDFSILGTNVNETVGREIDTVECPKEPKSSCECTVTFKNAEKVTYKLIQQEEVWKVDFELSKTEQILNNVTDFVGETFKEEIDAAVKDVGEVVEGVVEDAIDKGVEIITDSIQSKVGL